MYTNAMMIILTWKQDILCDKSNYLKYESTCKSL